MTYCPVFKGVRKILKEFNLLLTPEQAYKRVLSEVPITGFKNAKSLKDNLVRAVLPQLDRVGSSKSCEGQIFHVKFATHLKILQNFKKQNLKKLLTFLKALWIVIRAMLYITLNEKNVSLNSLM